MEPRMMALSNTLFTPLSLLVLLRNPPKLGSPRVVCTFNTYLLLPAADVDIYPDVELWCKRGNASQMSLLHLARRRDTDHSLTAISPYEITTQSLPTECD